MSNTKSWRDVFKVHPAADLFPMMGEDELKELGKDIKKHGQQVPIVFIVEGDEQPKLLDGRNRLDAMELVGLPVVNDTKGNFDLVEDVAIRSNFVSGIDPYAYVLSINVHRRHLNAEQKRDLIAAVVKARPEKSNRQIAAQVKADHKTVGDVRAKLQSTGEIPQLEKTVGKDGKARRVEKSKPDLDALPPESKAKLDALAAIIRDNLGKPRAIEERRAEPVEEAEVPRTSMSQQVTITGDEVGDFSAPIGTLLWVQAFRLKLKAELDTVDHEVGRVRSDLELLRDREWFRQLRSPDGEPFIDFAAFCEAPWPFGLGMQSRVREAILSGNRDRDTVGQPIADEDIPAFLKH